MLESFVRNGNLCGRLLGDLHFEGGGEGVTSAGGLAGSGVFLGILEWGVFMLSFWDMGSFWSGVGFRVRFRRAVHNVPQRPAIDTSGPGRTVLTLDQSDV